MSQAGNSNRITRNYLDSLLIETRYMNSDNPDTGFTLYGEAFSSPIMTAALSHLEQLGEGGMARGIALGAKMAGDDVPVFVDCMIQTGMDAFKAIALGAKGVCIGRPLMAAYTRDREDGVFTYLTKARDELAKAMAFTGCTDLSRMDPAVIHRSPF